MFEFLSDRKYINPTNLAEFQDFVIQRQGVNVEDVDKWIKELRSFDVLFTGFFGLNAIAENNLYIRQQVILAALYHIKKDNAKCKEAKIKADRAFNNLKFNSFYLEGYSYLLYVIAAYEFYFLFVSPYAHGSINLNSLYTVKNAYKNISAPDGSILTTDTVFTDKTNNPERLGYSNDLYSAYYMNNQTTFVFINHNTHISRLSKNLHINYEFGHFCLFDNEKWLILHPSYPGYKQKSESVFKEAWNNNVILDGANTREPYWRYLPKQNLEHEKKNNVHIFKIGKNITRKIEVLRNGLFVTDNGGDFSSFNIADDCKFNTTGKVIEKVGYHSPEHGKVETHKRVEISGDNRIFWVEF